MLIRVATILAFMIAATNALGQNLSNSSFETRDANGDPTNWFRFREGFVDSTTDTARSGSISVRSSWLFGWTQDIPVPVAPGRSFALAGHAKREFGIENAGAWLTWFDASGNFLGNTVPTSALPTSFGYECFFLPVTVPDGASRVWIRPGGGSSQEWPNIDDLSIVPDSPWTASDTPADFWQLESGGTVTTTMLHLPANGSATCELAAGLTNERYLVRVATNASAPGLLRVTETWLARFPTESTGTVAATSSVPAGVGSHVFDLGRPTAATSGRVQLKFSNPGSTDVTITSVTRGSVFVDATILTLPLDGIDTPLVSRVVWPENITTASATILRQDFTPVVSLEVELRSGGARTQWQGDASPAGRYLLRWTFQDAFGFVGPIDRSFEIQRRSQPVPPPVSFSIPNPFAAAWIYARFDASATVTKEMLRLAYSDGYRWAQVHCRPEQVATVRAECDALGMPFVIYTDEIERLLRSSASANRFRWAEVRSTLLPILQPALTSPNYRGFYTIDEPSVAALSTLRSVHRAARCDGDLGFPFFAGNPILSPAQIISTETPAPITFDYPFSSGRDANHAAGVAAQFDTVRSAAAQTLANGKSLWWLPQQFEAPGEFTYRGARAAAHLAQSHVALAAGARVLMPFIYSSVRFIEGQRTPDLLPTPKLASARTINNRLNTRGWVLNFTSPPSVRLRDATGLVLAVEAQHTTAGPLLMVINCSDQRAVTATLSLGPDDTLSALDLWGSASSLSASPQQIRVTLPPGEMALMLGDSTGISAMAADFEPLSDIEFQLPILYDFTHTSLSGAAPAIGVSFSPDAQSVAISTGERWFEPAPPPVYELRAGGIAQRASGSPTYPNERAKFLPDGRFVRISTYLGARMFTPLFAASMEFVGRTGGLYDIAGGGGNFYASSQFYGVRRLTETATALLSAEAALSESADYTTVNIVPADGSAVATVGDTAITSLQPGKLTEAQQLRITLRRANPGARISDANLLAVPRGPQGVALLAVGQSGAPPEPLSEIQNLTDATAVAFLREDILAVCDGVEGVRIYNVSTAAAPQYVGRWSPGGLTPLDLRGIDYRGGRIAVSTGEGRVIVAEAQAILQQITTAKEWLGFE